MKLASLITLSLYVSGHLMAQEFNLPLWPDGRIPNALVSADQEKSESTDIVRISKVQVPGIAVFLPSKKNATGQAVVICPGGGYGILAYDWEGTDIAKWLNGHGIAAIVLKYRLPESSSNKIPHLSPLMDVQRAIRMVRFYAKDWHIKPDQIGVMGFSAGGHLASTAGTHSSEDNSGMQDEISTISARPDFMALIYPVITMSLPLTHGGSRKNLLGGNPDEALVTRYSNELQVTDQTPQTFLVHATDDKVVPVENSILFYNALKAKNIPAEMHVYPKGGHGFSLALSIPGTSGWANCFIDWMAGLKK